MVWLTLASLEGNSYLQSPRRTTKGESRNEGQTAGPAERKALRSIVGRSADVVSGGLEHGFESREGAEDSDAGTSALAVAPVDGGFPVRSDIGSSEKSDSAQVGTALVLVDDGGIGHNHPPEAVAGAAEPEELVRFETPIAELLDRAARIGAGDFVGARNVLVDAYRRRLPGTERAVLREHLKASTGLSMMVIKEADGDAANHAEGYGFLSNTSAIAEAVRTILGRDYELILSTEGYQWGYATRPSERVSADEIHRWLRIDDIVLEATLLDQLKDVPLAQKAAARREVIQKLHLRHRERDDYFDDAEPGLNLTNGFLRLNTVTGSIELIDHDHNHRAPTS